MREGLVGGGRRHERDAESEDDGVDAGGEERKCRRRPGALSSAGNKSRSQGKPRPSRISNVICGLNLNTLGH